MPDDRPLSARCHRGTVVGCLLPFAFGLLAGCTSLPPWLAPDDKLTPTAADARAHDAAQDKLHIAVQASQPGHNRLTQARRALEQLLADERAEARTLHPYARALLEQIRERQRLNALNERLNRELDERERGVQDSGRALEDLRQQNAELQRKLDALTEIERRLSPPAVPAPPRTGGSG